MTLKVAVAVPTAVGVQLTASVQLPPAARLVPQVEAWLNDAAPAPPMVTEEIVKAAPPVFMSVACCALDAAPTVLEKVSVLGVSIGSGAATAVALKLSKSTPNVDESVVIRLLADNVPAVVGCTV